MIIRNNTIYQLQLQSDILTAATEDNVLIRYSCAIQNAPVAQITGFQIKAAQKLFWFVNQSGETILFKNDSESSFFGNRLSLPSGTDFSLPDGFTVQFFYDATSNSWFMFLPPVSGLLYWEPDSYNTQDQVIYLNKIWIALQDIISSEIPGTSPKWLVVGDQLKSAIYSEADIDGSLTWVGGTAPSGTITKRYVGSRTAKGFTQVWIKIRATIAGVAITQVNFPLPSALPTPTVWVSQPDGEIVSFGIGAFTSGGTVTYAGVYIKPVSGVYKIFCDQPYVAVNASSADISITYAS